MKKIAVLLVVVFALGVLISACSTSSKTCPAYGEHQQYQRETIY